ncbi:MAG TPA: tRNA pseudouridine(55) synthase TruB [Myxococcales bacterium]|nr:tRNA pseudouridine(55) synthase TruB [Myxococcales bacterium]
MAREVSGVVVVDKPSGPTSFDVVRRVKGLFKTRRCGHTGTLDPTATGVLPICIGDATKIASFVSDGEKEYDAVVRFGQITDTQDAAGRTLETRPTDGLTVERLREALDAFVGLVEQTPPMYSARKIEGRRLYEMARAGEEVEREARQVHIDEAKLVFFRPPDAGIFVRCSKGTYLRTLAHDLGQKLGCGGHLRELKRVRVGPFALEDSVGLDTLMAAAKEGGPESLDRYLFPISRALAELAELQLDAHLARRVAHGHAPGPADLSRLRAPPYSRGRKVRLMDPEGRVLAVGESDGVGTLKLLRVLVGGAHDLVEKDY